MTSDNPARILLVEDHPDAAESLRLLLELRGHEVRVAHNGVEGIGLACAWQPDVVISDLGLPVLDGYAVARALRPGGARLIAMSGYADAESRQLAHASGFRAFLAKPAPVGVPLSLLEDMRRPSAASTSPTSC
jgi:two-component system CheB/CheR fusion protein